MSLPYWEGVSATISKEYRLEILTPLLMHGWQMEIPRENKRPINEPAYAETRVPSMKGMLRYWWRSLQTDTLSASLLAKEQDLFGGTGMRNEEGSRSRIMLQIRQPLRTSSQQVPALPHREKNKQVPVKAVSERQHFVLTMRLFQKDAHLLETYHHWLCLMLMLSGFGQRARRGAGALQYEEFQWMTLQKFQDELQNLLQRCQRSKDFTLDKEGAVLKRVTGKGEHPVLCHVWVGRGYSSPMEARKEISRAGHEANPGGRPQWLGKVGGNQRVASPLHATVRRIGEKYHPVISEVIANADPQYGQREYLAAREHFLQVLGVK